MRAIIEHLRAAREKGQRPSAPGANLQGADLGGADLGGADLGGSDLRDANLEDANLEDANLEDADLRDAHLGGADLRDAHLLVADLRDADLGGSDLRDANLRDVDLRGANLLGANLQGANLCGADWWGGLPIQAGASGSGYLIPTSEGWRLTIGCWKGRTLDDLRDLIEDRAEWPEATGAERDRRRPMLRAVLALCEAHIGQHEGLIEQLAERWVS